MNPLEIQDTLNLIVNHIPNPQDLLVNHATLYLLQAHPDLVFIRTHKKSDIPKCGLPKFLSIYTGSDALGIAIEHGNIAIVKHLTLVITDPYWICVASIRGHLETVKYLVSIGANYTTFDNYAIRCASENGHLETVKYLVSIGADYTAYDNYAIRWATKNNHIEVVNYLKSL